MTNVKYTNDKKNDNNKETILVLDDSVSFNNLISNLLKSESFQVISAYNSDTAIKQIKSKNIDLAITDIRLPGKDGIEFIRLVKKIKPQMKFIIMTGFPNIENQKEAYNEEVNAYLVKPFTNERFLTIINKVLKHDNSSDEIPDNIKFNLDKLLKSHRIKKETIIIEIIKENINARLYIKNGEVIHAVAGNKIGEEAFCKIQKWNSGKIFLMPYDGKGIKTIDNKMY